MSPDKANGIVVLIDELIDFKIDEALGRDTGRYRNSDTVKDELMTELEKA